jgi:hypothetical protein
MSFYNGASKVGFSGCFFEMLCKFSDELVTPSVVRESGRGTGGIHSFRPDERGRAERQGEVVD